MISNLFLVLSVLINIVIFFKHKKLSYMFNVYDYPNERKLHKHKTPFRRFNNNHKLITFFSSLFFKSIQGR